MVALVGFLGVLAIWSITASGETLEPAVQKLVEQHEANRILLRSIPKPYEIVYPRQLRHNEIVGINTRQHKMRHHGTHEHHKHVTMQIQLSGHRHKFKLELNEALLSNGITVVQYLSQHQQVILKSVEHCYYHGSVKRDEWSSIAVSTCNGIRGVIQLHNETYVIHPLLGGNAGTSHPHVVFKASQSVEEKCGNTHSYWLPFNELHKGKFARRLKYLKARKISRGNTQVKLKLALVFDTSVYAGLNFSQSDIVRHAIGTGNILDVYYKELDVRISLVYAELWNTVDQMKVTNLVRETLQTFLKFKEKIQPYAAFHIAQLVTSRPLDHNSVGMAVPDSICTDRAIGIAKSSSPFEPQHAAAVLAHMVGHNLGMKHDEDSGCLCEDQFGCLMSTAVLRSQGLHSRLFSSCSAQDLETVLTMGLASCLANSSQANFPQECGNKIIERGEECDCGSVEECQAKDPCCDPASCLLQSWASCKDGPCCHNCTVRPSYHICRHAASECDVPEYCDGVTGSCLPDDYVVDGHSCANSSGYCYKGSCPTKDLQCQGIWGSEATGGDDQCFDRFNPTGNFNGHCGRDKTTGRFAKCSPENVQCGLLHCSGGVIRPLQGPKKAFSKTTVFSNGVEYECKIVHGPTSLDLPHMGIVQDGTKCSDNKMCIKRECISLNELSVPTCPGKEGLVCSENGVCTQSGACFCFQGWGGSACSMVVNKTKLVAAATTTTIPAPNTLLNALLTPLVSSTYTHTPPITTATRSLAAVVKAATSEVNTMWLIIILASVIGGLILLLGITMFCYRRKSPQKLNVSTKLGFTACQESPAKSLEPAQAVPKRSRIISFGSLPSYKAEKLFGRKKHKKRTSSEDESDIGELPPPPIIITSPDSIRPPEKGILKNYRREVKPQMCSANADYSSYLKPTGYGTPYDEDDDVEGKEVREILGEDDDCYCREKVPDSSSRLLDLASFRLNLPPPPTEPPDNSPLSPFTQWQNPDYQRYTCGNTQGSPRSKIIRIKNIDELMREIDRQTIDLSPSPETPHLPQISPVNSVISSENSSNGQFNNHESSCLFNGQKLRGPTSTEQSVQVSGCECSLLKNSASNESQMCNILPMSPTRINSILHYAHSVPVSDVDFGSICGTVNSRGFDKSSGYESERDPERSSIDDGPRSRSRSQSRSQSGSPPCYSAVIRTGPNQIRLVPASQMQQKHADGSSEELQKLLEGLPRIDAGTFERSPVCAGVQILGIGQEPIPNPRPLKNKVEESGSGPCIDRSLEEISQNFGDSQKLSSSKIKPKGSLNMKSCRPASLGVMQRSLLPTLNFHPETDEKENLRDSRRYSVWEDRDTAGH